MVSSICSFEQKGEKSHGCRVSRRTTNHGGLQILKKAVNKTARGCEVLNYIRDGLMNKVWMEGSKLCNKWWRCTHIEIRPFGVAYDFWQVKLILLCLLPKSHCVADQYVCAVADMAFTRHVHTGWAEQCIHTIHPEWKIWLSKVGDGWDASARSIFVERDSEAALGKGPPEISFLAGGLVC